jgi:hypothetical protein
VSDGIAVGHELLMRAMKRGLGGDGILYREVLKVVGASGESVSIQCAGE